MALEPVWNILEENKVTIFITKDFSAMYRGFLLSNAISLINFNLYLAFASAASEIEIGADYKNFINGDTIAAVSALLLLHPLDSLK